MSDQTLVCLVSHFLENTTFYQTSLNITQLSISPSNAIAITNDGKPYMWGLFDPAQEKNKSYQYFKAEPKLIKNIGSSKIIQVSCINSAALMLTTDGTIYAFGEDIEKNGILGLGGINYQSHPTAITSLIDQKYDTQ